LRPVRTRRQWDLRPLRPHRRSDDHELMSSDKPSLMTRIRRWLRPGRKPVDNRERMKVDEIIAEGRPISTDHMTEKIQHPGNHF